MKLGVLLHFFISFSITGILFLSILGFPLHAIAVEEEDAINDLKTQIDEKERAIQELKEIEKTYVGAVSEKRAEARSLQDLIFDYNSKMEMLEADIERNKEAIEDANLRIKQTEIEIETRTREIERTKEFIGATLREIYQSSDEEIMELMFQYEHFSDFFNQVQYRYLLQNDLSDKLQRVKDLKEKLEEEKIELDAHRKQLNLLKEELEARNLILESQRQEKETVLVSTKNEEAKFKSLLDDTRGKQEDIQRQIFELEEKLREAIDKTKLPIAAPGVLSWPAEGTLTQGYGCTEFAKNSKYYPTCFHNGIDIAAPYGTSIKAARDGKVLAVYNAPYAYGKWIAIEHDNSLVTLYAHLSLQTVSAGKEVSRGDVIGYMGSTGISTGSHIHFTVYAPFTFNTKPSTISGTLPIGGTLNPFDYLP
ncbi:MAG: hypothetical protein A3B96_02105 [Candidatus Spechtbacteria bacterium RIFCSPHIGHO2_02_FULL_43_15b]|uniref:M23ase beta-sheet core domain-containing protein n=1 Tax=Candidatus Spechtbacteria bacterium RIFCSPHIGHO2_01_FULL_43_30 TaxID=1802158 RepID=A0A1G2H419_9BACT|nr:MAG: hypothetical protein A2827_02055 [Candidatus Spechtbacteria bacterium RIFCSPHIGHO2_01_FULL_43_30]OGZ58844.1 MAG: hypothetical protein A3B96_02105 [Candidatus Spechtbacteria bacterium RIFCSPHIGHO2_02_FULL_43_15b]